MNNTKIKRPDEQIINLIKLSGSNDLAVAMQAQAALAKAYEQPIREMILDGDNLGNIFTPIPLEPGAIAEFSVHFRNPGDEERYVAYSNPGYGYIPQRLVEGDFFVIQTSKVANAIGWPLKYAQQARWDIISDARDTLLNGFVKKFNRSGWHTLLYAGADRNVLVYDADAAAGQFTKRLVSLMSTYMKRNGGGNSTSLNRSQLTDLFISPEAFDDIRNWKIDQIDPVTQREIFVSSTNMMNIFGVDLREISELGVGQEYTNFYLNQIGGTLPGSDVELVVGLDMSKSMTFVNPIRENVTIFNDPNLHRNQEAGFYGWADMGWGVLDTRRIILGSF